MKSLLLAISIGAFGFASSGQTVLKVVTIDKSNNDPVHQAPVSFSSKKGKSADVYTNKRGEALLTVPSGDTVVVSCDHISYTEASRKIFTKGGLKDTLKVVLYLNFVTVYKPFIVRPEGVPSVLFKSERVSVDDFEFLPDGRMVLLTYAKNKRKGTELFLYDGEEVLTEISLEEMGNELIRDYRGNPHVITEKSVYGINSEANVVSVGTLDKKYYMTYIAPIVDTTVSKYFFSNFNPDYPAFEYYSYGTEDSSYRKIAKIEDELMMELYRSEYKWVDIRTKLWAKTLENETGIDKEIWVGANYFTQSIYYKELYAPLFERNDTVFLFDHYKNKLYRYDDTGELLDSVPIFHHFQEKVSGWQKQLIQDQSTGEVYSIYEKTGQVTLRRIDLTTGEMKETIPLYYKYPDKILIRSNHVYYTYRPFETAQKKYLYDEKLPFSFPETGVLHGDQVTSH